MTSETSIGSIRRLLSRIRQVMAGSGSAQARLDKVVEIIAADLVAEVCSVYLMRAGEVLELFATQGLKPSAVHKTRLRTGEGVIGDIAAHAAPLALNNARAHPAFALRPETGEEDFHSMLGVPIQRAGRVIGVLAVQNRTKRNYQEEEIETLETVAMVLAELVASGELVNPEEVRPVNGIATLPMRLSGLSLNSGIARGQAVLHEPPIHLTEVVADEPDQELSRLRQAIKDMHGALDSLLENTLFAEGEHRDVLETYRMIAEDVGWIRKIEDAVKSGLSAPGAVQKVQNETRQRMASIKDPYFRERMHDLDDLANRLLRYLTTDHATGLPQELPDDVILVARSLGPAELLDYDPTRLRGVALEEASPTAHVVIVAKALDIPVVGCIADLTERISVGDPVIIDGSNGQVFVRPPEDVVQAFNQATLSRARQRAEFAEIRDRRAISQDGIEISLKINAGLLMDVERLQDTGADGIGLYRTEIPFMVRERLPDVTAQTEIYRRVYTLADQLPVVFRTLDAGGDKVLPYWNRVAEENPALGWRAIRLSLDRPAILRHQLRAMIQAANGNELRVMFPMVAEVAEFQAARHLLQRELDRQATLGGAQPKRLMVGAMLEVPSLLHQMPTLLRHVDFLSVGSNDLFQFLFACDRSNPNLAHRYDTLSPPILNVLRHIREHCDATNTPLSLCGEMGGRPLEAMALVGLGFREISMAPTAIGPVKAMILSLNIQSLQDYMGMLSNSAQHSIRQNLRAYASDHGVRV